MALYIANNLSAATAHRWLQASDASMSRSIERLSSGFRINSAADDAAGLVISETLRTGIAGIQQASNNTTNAVNMMKTAEKALDEQETQLRKIRTLVLHAGNNTGSAEALAADQAEINQAVSAIDRIATQTTFGGISLLNAGTDGEDNINGRTFQLGSEQGQSVTFSLPSTFAGTTISADMTALSLGMTQSAAGSGPSTATAGTAAYAAGGAANFKYVDITYSRANGTTYHVVSTFAATSTIAQAETAINADIDAAVGAGTTTETTAGGFRATTDAGATKLIIRATTNNTADQSASASVSVVSYSTDGSVSGFENGQTHAGVANTTTRIDVEAGSGYDTYLGYIDSALKKVNGLRVNMGAFQRNNLESNLARLAVAKENLQASESSIRDTDMADEMVNFTKSQILMQAGQAMMAQANQAPNSILQMLR